MNSSPAAFLGEAEEGKVEVLVKQTDDVSSKDDLDEFQLETPKSCGIDPRSPSRRSAKSRLGLISVNRGFTVDLLFLSLGAGISRSPAAVCLSKKCINDQYTFLPIRQPY